MNKLLVMLLLRRYCLLLIITYLFPLNGFGQFFLSNTEPINLETSFVRQSIESRAKQTFFNVLKIKNLSNRVENLYVNLSVPEGWSVVGSDRIELNINPQDSIFVPIRVAVGSNARGDIGYSIIASITDIRGNTVKNEYSYVKIPRIAGFRISSFDRLSYLDPQTNTASFTLSMQNRGNKQELVNIVLQSEPSLIIEENANQYSIEVNLPQNSDTTIAFSIRYRELSSSAKKIFRLNMQVSTQDSVYTGTAWYTKLESDYINYIPSNTKPLVIDFTTQGLLRENQKPSYVLLAEGNLIFDDKKTLYYHYRNFTSRSIEDLYKYNRMYVGGKYKNFTMELGDNYRSSEVVLMGRGAFFEFDNRKYSFTSLGNINPRTEVVNFLGSAGIRASNNLQLKADYIYNQNPNFNFNKLESHMGVLRSNFSIMKIHNFQVMGAYNIINTDGKELNEYSGSFNYSLRQNRTTLNLRTKYGSPGFYGTYRGKFNGALLMNHFLKSGNILRFQFFEFHNTRGSFNTIVATDLNNTSINRNAKLDYQYFINPKTSITAGLGFDNSIWNNLKPEADVTNFNSITPKLFISARFRLGDSFTILSPQLTLGKASIIEAPEGEQHITDATKNMDFQELSVFFRTAKFGLVSSFTSGPKTIFEQIATYYSGRPYSYLRFMPTYDAFIYKDIMELNLNVSYNNDLQSKSTYSNITAQLQWHLKSNWLLRALGVYSLQNRIDIWEASQIYQTIYLEAGVRKEFGFNHPSVRYHDIELVFFKDFNGNNIQEPTEPGIKSVLVEINKLETDKATNIPGDLYSVQLISNNFGRVSVEKIPEGKYSINYNPIGGDAGTFSKAFGDMEFTVDRSGEYIFPFVEKNKVFGKIILNRSRLSGLGRVDVSNVRITATDSQGRSYSTLTDRNGEFVLFAPVTDEYILTINNIYYENFDLRQNSFLVQFNGYKQFEVNFVFDEKVRRINFAATDQDMQQGVQQVRRTTISGSVKDANTQQAIRAKVNLINTRTNAIVASVNSSATSGDYTLNFMASDDYLLEVLADDYWYFSENLVLQQVTTFMNINRNIQLKPISVGSSIELNIQFGANSDYLAPESVAELNRLLRQVRNNPTVRLEIQGHCDDLEAIQKPDIGRDRAGAVAKYLIENGFSNVEVKDMKNNVPLTSNDTEEGRARNRRIDVVVLRR